MCSVQPERRVLLLVPRSRRGSRSWHKPHSEALLRNPKADRAEFSGRLLSVFGLYSSASLCGLCQAGPRGRAGQASWPEHRTRPQPGTLEPGAVGALCFRSSSCRESTRPRRVPLHGPRTATKPQLRPLAVATSSAPELSAPGGTDAFGIC